MMPWMGKSLDKGFQKAAQGHTWISVINWTYHDAATGQNQTIFFTLKKGYTPETSVLIDKFDTLR